MTTPSKLDEARLRELRARAERQIRLGERTGADGNGGSPQNIYVIAKELLDALSAERKRGDRAVVKVVPTDRVSRITITPERVHYDGFVFDTGSASAITAADLIRGVADYLVDRAEADAETSSVVIWDEALATQKTEGA